jgi:hypothetical protein
MEYGSSSPDDHAGALEAFDDVNLDFDRDSMAVHFFSQLRISCAKAIFISAYF